MKDRQGNELGDIKHLTIESGEYGNYVVYGHGEYERSSVNYGQNRRVFIESYDSVEEAQEDYPKAEETGCTKVAISLPDCPPSWFDPANAGECWHEDDY